MKVSGAAVMEALRAAYHSGGLETICATVELNLKTPCELRFSQLQDGKIEVFLVNPDSQKILHRGVIAAEGEFEWRFDTEGKALGDYLHGATRKWDL